MQAFRAMSLIMIFQKILIQIAPDVFLRYKYLVALSSPFSCWFYAFSALSSLNYAFSHFFYFLVFQK